MQTIVFGLGTVFYKGFVVRAIEGLYVTLRTNPTEPNHPVLKEVFEELDLEVFLEVIEALIREIPDEDTSSEATSICIKNIERSILKIQEELLELYKLGSDHQSKWFSDWRTFNVNKNISNLRMHKKVLDQRVDLLMKILSIQKSPYQMIKPTTIKDVSVSLISDSSSSIDENSEGENYILRHISSDEGSTSGGSRVEFTS